MNKKTINRQNLDYFWKKKTIISFIAIFFIITIHNSATGQYQVPTDSYTNITWFFRNLLSYGIGSVAVPLFFFLSGLTLFRNYQPKLHKQKMLSRAKSLLIPFLIWNTIGIIFAILSTYTPLSTIISGREPFSFSFQNLLQGLFLYKYNYHYWFMYNLIIFTILTPLFDILLSKKWLATIFIPIFLCLPLIKDTFIYIDFSFIIFYYLGCYIGKFYLKHFLSPIPLRFSLLSGLLSLILITVKMLSLYQIITPPIIINQIIITLLATSLWFFSDAFISKTKKLKYSNEFFPVYTIHPYIIAAIVKTIYLAFPHTSYMMLINELFSSILTLIITTIIVHIWHQKLPKSYAIMFGRYSH